MLTGLEMYHTGESPNSVFFTEGKENEQKY